MKNLPIGKKLFTTFAVILLLFLITMGAGFMGLNGVSKSYSYFSGTVYKLNSRVLNMRRDIQASAKFVMYAITSPDMAKNYIEEAQSCLDSLSDGIDFLYEHSTADKNLIDGIKSNLESLTPCKEQLFELVLARNNDKALKLYYTEYYPLLAEANENLLKVSDDTASYADATYQKASSQIHTIFLIMGAIACVIFFVTIILGIYITRNLKRPISEIEKAAKSLAQGELSNTGIDYESRDELGVLAENMRQTVNTLSSIIGDIAYLMKEMANGNFDLHSTKEDSYRGDFRPVLLSIREMNMNLSETMWQINESSDQVASGSEQVSSSAQALSQSSTEQASSVELLASTVNEISKRVGNNAKNASEASEVALEMGGEMLSCNQKMQDMIGAMDEISASSSEIRKIIQTIEDIAFQTNILALNAAVEAARAGAAGKGFAVVANEVRNLASKSAEASQNTANLIERSIQAVENGTKIADETAGSLMAVVERAKAMTSNIEKIANASNEQAQSISQVTQGIEQISAVVQTNSASAEQSAAASEELSSQAQIMKQLVEHFRLRAGRRSQNQPPQPFFAPKSMNPNAKY